MNLSAKKICFFLLTLALTVYLSSVYASATFSEGSDTVESLALTSFSGGSGTIEKPYLISTAAQLNEMRNYRDKHFKLTSSIVFRSSDFASGGAFYNGGAGWDPIGTSSAPFTGTLDGNGKSISGLYINANDSNFSGKTQVGLFGYMSGGSVKNLRLTNANIRVNCSKAMEVGGIAGYAASRDSGFSYLFENCSFSGEIVCVSTNDARYSVGGIVGKGGGDSNSSGADHTVNQIKSCSNSGTIRVNIGNVGGIIGQRARVTNSYNTGKIIGGTDKTKPRGTTVGGIAGYSTIVMDCYNTADLSGTTVGGITGGYGIISGCYNTGDVTGTNSYSGMYYGVRHDGTSHVGGISGGSSDLPITDCYNTGSVTSEGYSGGISGKSGKLAQCYNIGTVTGDMGAGPIWGEKAGSSSQNLYYLTGCCASNSDGVSIGYTSSQLQRQYNFSGYEFDFIWTMSGNNYYPYPELQNTKMQTGSAEVLNCSIQGETTQAIPYKSDTAQLKLRIFANYRNEYMQWQDDVSASSKWSIVGENPGVSISGSTVTITPAADAGTLSVQAVYSGKTLYHNIELTKESAGELYLMTIQGPDSITAPDKNEAAKTRAYTVSGEDRYGISTPAEIVRWSLMENVPTGVSIDLASGVLTVEGDAGAGTFVIRAEGSETCFAETVVEIKPVIHQQITRTPEVPATCCSIGTIAHWHCSVCDRNYTDAAGTTQLEDVLLPISPDHHTGGTEEKGAKAPTCLSPGHEDDTYCLGCGEKIADGNALPAKGHTTVTDAAVPATCTKSGLTEGKHCDTCSEVFIAQETVPATNHKNKHAVDASAATCTQTGLTEGEYCPDCQSWLIPQAEIPVIPHSHTETFFVWEKDLSGAIASGQCDCGHKEDRICTLTWSNDTPETLTVTASAEFDKTPVSESKCITAVLNGDTVSITLPNNIPGLIILAATYADNECMISCVKPEIDGSTVSFSVTEAPLRVFFLTALYCPISPSMNL